MSKKIPIDFNCDLGEGIGNDALLMPYLGSCNIACGGHVGDVNSIQKALTLAKKHGVLVGAHPSYPDVENFGRVVLNIEAATLLASLLKQINLFVAVCKVTGSVMHHVKLHGALYNEAAKDPKIANLVVDMMAEHYSSCFLFCPENSELEKQAKTAGLKVKKEVFADRNYNDDLTLVARGNPKALLLDPAEALEHVIQMVEKKSIKTIHGNLVPVEMDTVCVHGDNPAALAILNKLVQHFKR